MAGTNADLSLDRKCSPKSPAMTQVANMARRLPPSDASIYKQIYAGIMEHYLPPGTKLTEDALAQVFKVSRTRVRTVLLRLAHENIAVLQKNRGAFVAKPSVKEARDVFAARRLLDPGMATHVAERISPEQVAALRRCIARERAAHRAGDHRAMIKLSADFHLELAAVLGNEALTGFLRELVSRTPLIIAVYERPGASSCRRDEHARLVDLLAKGEANAVKEAMRQHLQGIDDALMLVNLGTPKVNLRRVLRELSWRRPEYLYEWTERPVAKGRLD